MKTIMKQAVALAKTFEGSWTARMALALKTVWAQAKLVARQARFFYNITLSKNIEIPGNGVRTDVHYKDSYMGAIIADPHTMFKTEKRYKISIFDYKSKSYDTVDDAILDLAKLHKQRKVTTFKTATGYPAVRYLMGV